ncbi:hypothetical protein AB0L13_29645 [Saccharopolyspora shandongensis]|uniref:hypothetical protein n=1 Tax=Saccharopolyspora shandongensis TaxID=418495 RepID=UPI0034454F0B
MTASPTEYDSVDGAIDTAVGSTDEQIVYPYIKHGVDPRDLRTIGNSRHVGKIRETRFDRGDNLVLDVPLLPTRLAGGIGIRELPVPGVEGHLPRKARGRSQPGDVDLSLTAVYIAVGVRGARLPWRGRGLGHRGCLGFARRRIVGDRGEHLGA